MSLFIHRLCGWTDGLVIIGQRSSWSTFGAHNTIVSKIDFIKTSTIVQFFSPWMFFGFINSWNATWKFTYEGPKTQRLGTDLHPWHWYTLYWGNNVTANKTCFIYKTNYFVVSWLAWPVFLLFHLDAEDLHLKLRLTDAHWLSCCV